MSAIAARLTRALAACTLAVVLASGCKRSSREARPEGSARIVSVGGAVTESLFALGAGDRVVGADTSSVHPAAATRLPQVGYQRALSAEGIVALRPSLVMASAEAGPPAVLEQLRAAGIRVEVLSAEASAAAARSRVARIGAIVERDPSSLLAELDADLGRARALAARVTKRPRVLVLYARGASTLHVFGARTSAAEMVHLGCGENAVTAFEGARPLTSESVVSAAPDVILLPSRGLDALGGVDAVLEVPGISETPAGRSRRVVALDDLLLLGFGPRTGKAALELCEKLHPELAQAAP
jgi:iron complex transport system substrate-binding protein